MMRLLASFFILFCAVTAWFQPSQAKPITLAYQTPTLSSNLPIFVAMDLGFFAAENLEVKTVFIQGGPTAIAALIGGDVDYRRRLSTVHRLFAFRFQEDQHVKRSQGEGSWCDRSRRHRGVRNGGRPGKKRIHTRPRL
jgi:hypothetical protein